MLIQYRRAVLNNKVNDKDFKDYINLLVFWCINMSRHRVINHVADSSALSTQQLSVSMYKKSLWESESKITSNQDAFPYNWINNQYD